MTLERLRQLNQMLNEPQVDLNQALAANNTILTALPHLLAIAEAAQAHLDRADRIWPEHRMQAPTIQSLRKALARLEETT